MRGGRAAASDGWAWRRAAPVLAALALLLPALAFAQSGGPATLVADRVFLTQPGRLVAEGNVEVFHGPWRLRADRLTYDPDTDTISADGALMLSSGDDFVVVADTASLDADLRAGIVQSARLVLNEQLQIAGAEVVRSEDRYTELRRAVASSCEVCAEGGTPLWEIRARRVIHDQQERQVHFEGAQFRVAGLPILYLPHLRVPDPSNTRATGFLRPSLSFGTALGYGLRAPIFVVLDDHRDLTLTPFVTSRGSRTMEARYRQAFVNGFLELSGALTRDRLTAERFRGFGAAEGSFALGRGFVLGFDAIGVSDRDYLADYDITDQLRLSSDVTVQRVQRDERVRVQGLGFQSLRPGDDNAVLPTAALRAEWERRFDMPGLGGRGQLLFEGLAHRRSDGRDVARLSALADWRRDWVLQGGLVAAAGAQLAVDHFRIADDVGFDSPVTRTTPALMAELRWPLIGQDAAGGVHVVEPVAQVIWSDNRLAALPNDTSLMPELDEGNLFGIDRFAGGDRRERGLRANLGASWTRYDPAGWSGAVTLGRVVRARDLGQFAPASPLSGRRSDWLAAVQLDTGDGLSLNNRALFSDDLQLARNDLQLDWDWQGGSLSTGVLYIRADPDEERFSTSAEWRFDAGLSVDDNWTARVDWRYDLEENTAARAGMGLEYRTECVSVDVSVSRRFGETGSLARDTSIGLSVALLGLGGSPAGAPPSRCRN